MVFAYINHGFQTAVITMVILRSKTVVMVIFEPWLFLYQSHGSHYGFCMVLGITGDSDHQTANCSFGCYGTAVSMNPKPQFPCIPKLHRAGIRATMKLQFLCIPKLHRPVWVSVNSVARKLQFQVCHIHGFPTLASLSQCGFSCVF